MLTLYTGEIQQDDWPDYLALPHRREVGGGGMGVVRRLNDWRLAIKLAERAISN